jgi:hypothetical protein
MTAGGVQLDFLDQDRVERAWRLAPGRTRVGRAPDNDLVIPEPAVSGYHLLLTSGPDGVEVRDLGSTNGTFVNEERVQSTSVLNAGDLLRVGLTVRCRVRLLPAEAAPAEHWLVHVNTGRAMRAPLAFVLEHLLAGDDEGDDEAGPPHALRIEGDRVIAERDGQRVEAALGAHLQLGPHRVLVVDGEVARERTLTAVSDDPWTLRVDVDAGGGPEAAVLDPDGEVQGVVRAGNRVTVLHLLACQVLEDRAAGLVDDEVGWCGDEALMRGVWGRQWSQKGPASFQVLVHRVRKDLVRLGLSGALLEKRGGRSRLRPGLVQLQVSRAPEA